MKNYRFLLPYVARHRLGWSLIVVVTLLSIGFGLLAPLPMKLLVDSALGTEPAPEALEPLVARIPADPIDALIVIAVLGGLAVWAIIAVVDVALTFAWIRVGQRMVYDLAESIFARVQRRSLRFHSQTSVGELMSRIAGDSWALHSVVDALLFAPAYAAITFVAVFAVMASMHLGLAVLAVLAAPLMALASYAMGRRTRAAARANRDVQGQIHSHVQRTLTGIPVVQAFAQEEREHALFRSLADSAIRAARRGTVVGSITGLSSGLITTIGTGAILFAGARLVLAGELTVGALLAFLSYLATLQIQIAVFTGMYTRIQVAGASVDRVMEILDAEPEVADAPGAVALPPVAGHVRIEGVTFGYEPARPVLRDVTLEARPGEVVALVGATGAGKSTLAGLVARFNDPWSGRVTIDGHDLRDVRLRSLREQVALVLQESFLFPLTIAENIAYGRPDATREEIEAAARAANAHAFISRLPEGYDSLVGERGATLSGGERQRLSIARALLKDAPILILDEPTSALDAETEALMLGALERLMAGRTTFIIAHRLSTIRHADRIVVLRDGEIVEQGRHAELLARRGAYARLHRIQAGELEPDADIETQRSLVPA